MKKSRVRYKHTVAKKWNGDDSCSWAIFKKNHPEYPIVSGLTSYQVSYERPLIEAKIERGEL